ncbi:MAG: tRNA pseudouridine(13) synthase TruD [Lysobacteraceae bacterium]
MTTHALPRAFAPAPLHARFRARPEDFEVDETLGFDPDGHGEHLFLRVRKRGANTAWVAAQLARWAGIDERGVGYAGLKDRHAVTTQTFSLHLPGREAPAAWPQSDELDILEASRHGRKLPRGALRGNRFRIVLREVRGEREAIEAQLGRIREHGFPNYFGEQRFGHAGGNLDAARRLFAGRRMDRNKRAIALSAARAELFNSVLAVRIGENCWNRGLDGEVWMLDGSRSVFGPQTLDAELTERLQRGDIHPSGPLWGRGTLRSEAAAQALETRALAGFEDIQRGLESAGLNQERRALRVIPTDMDWRWPQPETLELDFFLPAGSYATALLRELGEVEEAD